MRGVFGIDSAVVALGALDGGHEGVGNPPVLIVCVAVHGLREESPQLLAGL